MSAIAPEAYGYDLGIPDGCELPECSPVPAAQAWFERGMVWMAGFHREEVRCRHGLRRARPLLSARPLQKGAFCFEQALAHDASAAMACWGLALCHGPDYNFNKGFTCVAARETGWPSLKRAHEAAARAVELSSPEPARRAMFGALALRYEWPLTAGAEGRKVPYAEAAAAAAAAHPACPELNAMAAEAAMCLRPWDLYDRAAGVPVLNETGAAVARFVAAGLKSSPRSHWLCHLKVHLNEMGPRGDFDWASAEVLRGDGVACTGHGHLLHMPSHLDIQVGAYARAIRTNRRAYEADKALLAVSSRTMVWTGYFVHNVEFAAWAAFFAANRSAAFAAVAEVEARLTPAYIEASAMAQEYDEAYTTLRTMALVRFGCWDEMLQVEARGDPAVHAMHSLFRHFGRGLALAARGDVPAAEQEQVAFLALLPSLQPGARMKHNVDGRDMAGIAREVLAAEILYRQGSHDAAFEHLRRGVELSDALPYDEPHGWMMSVRQTLGALLTEQGRHEEAIKVYLEDLDAFPKNVWGASPPPPPEHVAGGSHIQPALTGLKHCYGAIGDAAGLSSIDGALTAAQQDADITVGASCACALSSFSGAPKTGCGACSL